MPKCICKICCCRPRLTKQRKIILEELRKVRTHPTAEEVYKVVKKRIASINLATVYRNLDFLEKDKQILKLKHKGEDQKSHYDGYTTNHYYLICKNCGMIADIEDCHCILMDNKKLAKKYGFEADPNSIEVMGLCKKCKKSTR